MSVDLAIGGAPAVAVLGQGALTLTVLIQMRDGLGVGKKLVPRLSHASAADSAERRVAIARLEREARILSALGGRGGPRLLGSGSGPGGPWLVMEHVPLPKLSARFPLPADARAALVAALALAALGCLADLHEARDDAGPLEVVHGDPSPENLLAADDGTAARLVDFGLASFRDAAREPGDHEGAVAGTLLYMAPEVACGGPPTQASDLFSTALSLLHAAHPEGSPPRAGREPGAVLASAGDAPVDAYARAAAAGLPAEVGDRLVQSVAFDPRARPPSARAAWRGSW